MTKGYIIKHLFGTLIFFAVLFVSAGNFNFLGGWLYVFLGLIMFTLSNTIWRLDDDLMLERSTSAKKAESWDKKIVGLSFIATLGMFIVAGLDDGRFHWTIHSVLQGPSHPYYAITFFGARLIGLLLTAIGQVLFLVAQKQNHFFSSLVRLQTERNHQVMETGLYSFVRHPAYLGNLIQTLGFPLLFCSYWAILPAMFNLILTIIRTQKEDDFLSAQLAGYERFKQKTKFKLIPGLF